MPATMSAREWRIRELLNEHAAAEGWRLVTPRLLGRIAKLAAQAAEAPRPSDAPPRGRGKGRKTTRKASGRPPEPRTPVRASSATPEGVSGAPGAVSANRGAA